MKTGEIKKKYLSLLRDELPEEEKDEIYSALRDEGIDRTELEEIRRVDRMFDELPLPDPAERMDTRFRDLLGDEKRKELESGIDRMTSFYSARPAIRITLRIAAGIALFLLGWYASSRSGQSANRNSDIVALSDEVKGLKETLILTMMEQNSPTDRIRAVNMAGEFNDADNRVINGLLKALNSDENDNVRLLALEALLKYSANTEVRKGLVSSIAHQSSPMIQLRLTEVMIALNEKSAADEFRRIVTDASTNFTVRKKMDEAITVLL